MRGFRVVLIAAGLCGLPASGCFNPDESPAEDTEGAGTGTGTGTATTATTSTTSSTTQADTSTTTTGVDGSSSDTTATSTGDSDSGSTTAATEEVIIDMVEDLCNFGPDSAFYYDPNANPSSGNLPCPGDDQDARGSVTVPDQITLETGIVEEPGLLVRPPESDGTNAQINVRYDYVTIEAGDRLQATVGCGAGLFSCSAAVSVTARDLQNNPAMEIVSFDAMYNGGVVEVDEPLDALAGQTVRISLVVLAEGTGSDWIYWVQPRVIRPL